VPWNTPTRFLLYAVANHAEGAARILPLVKDALEAADTNVATTAVQTCLHTARVLLSRGAVPRDELAELAAVLARHARARIGRRP